MHLKKNLKNLKDLKGWMVGSAVVTFSIFASPLPSPLLGMAQADAYHAVEPGETLSKIAARYGTRTETLRLANKLTGIADNAALPPMLLRIPETDKSKSDPARSKSDKFATVAITPSTSNSTAPSREAQYSGSVTKSLRYTVRDGDTLESIAAQYAQTGYSVSAADIRQYNKLTTQPAAGSTLIVPVQKMMVGAAAQIAPSQSTAKAVVARAISTGSTGSGGDAVAISEELELPFAQAVPQRDPVYAAPNRAPKPSAKTTTRRPSLLASRGYAPSPNLDGARLLRDGEESSTSTSPSPRVINPSIINPAPAPKLAEVAQVARYGARIRRLPTSEAVTLYRCATGTELAVTNHKGIWSSILMSDRSTGWVPTRYLKFTGAQVDIATQVVTGAAAWGGAPSGGGRYSYDGHYSSSNPMVAQALSWLGTPYVYGGESRSGIDCSSLVQKSFAACGYRLPRTAAEQARIGAAVDPARLQAGDRLYFSASGTRIDHTGLYMGDGLFVHASGHGHAVMVSNLFDRRNWNIFVGARR